MNSLVANTIGTSKQFSTQPQDLYARRINQVSSGVTGSVTVSDDATLLARSLGVLGDALMTESADNEKRREKLGIYAVDKIMAGKSAEDLEKMKSIDMINSFTDFDIQDNPYARVYLEKLRGKFFGQKAREAYAEKVATDGYSGIKTDAEETTRFDNHMSGEYQKSLELTTDPEAFKSGFYDNHLVNQLERVEKFREHRAKENIVLRKSATEADFADIVHSSFSLTKEQVAEKAQLVFNGDRMTSADLLERKEFATNFVKDLAYYTGNTDLINHLADKVVVATDIDGKDVTLRTAVGDMTTILNTSDTRRAQIQDEKVTAARTRLGNAKTKDEITQMYAGWQKEDPDFFITMTHFREQAENTVEAKIRKQQAAEQNKKESAHLRGQIDATIEANYSAHYWNKPMDANGRPTAISSSGLPKIQYKGYHEDGSAVDKEYSISAEDIADWANRKMAWIIQNSGDDSSRGYNLMRFFSYPPLREYAKSYSNVIMNSLGNLSPDRLAYDANGQPMLEQNVNTAMILHDANPELFYGLFGENVANEVEAIKGFTELSEGDLKAGVQAYATSRDAMRDPNLRATIERDVQNKLNNATLEGFLDYDGNTITLKRGLETNAEMEVRMKRLVEAYVAGGMDVDTAYSTALAKANNTQYVYLETAIPKYVWNGVETADKQSVGKAVLDYYVQLTANEGGTDVSHAIVKWNYSRNVLEIRANNAYRVLRPNDLTWAGNEVLKQWQEASANNPDSNVSYDQYLDDTTLQRLPVENDDSTGYYF